MGRFVKLNDPSDYHLLLSGTAYRLLRDSFPAKFAAPVSTRGIAKLYTLFNEESLMYVGITRQSLSARLSYGFRANGASGYHGYKWKSHEGSLRLSVWTAQSDGNYASLRDLETVEAEVAFLCRQDAGQWPKFQHEIHFYPSSLWHREAAARIYSHAARARVELLNTDDDAALPQPSQRSLR
jgi:hypothetical protein